MITVQVIMISMKLLYRYGPASGKIIISELQSVLLKSRFKCVSN